MGALTLPTSGTVYVDACTVIYTVEQHPDYAPLLRPLWQAASTGTIDVATSDLTFLEVLVLPLRNSQQVLLSEYRRLLLHDRVRLLDVTRSVLFRAAELRAQIPGLATPDAIHAASAIEAGCALFVSNDAGFRRVSQVPLTLLSDVAGS